MYKNEWKVLEKEHLFLLKHHYASITCILLSVIKSEIMPKFAKQIHSICSTVKELVEDGHFSESTTSGKIKKLERKLTK